MVHEKKMIRIYQKDAKKRNQVQELLEQQHLKFENTVTETYGMYDGERLIATGSIFQNVLKMIAVDPMYQGSEVINKLMSHLITMASNAGQTHLFMFTTPLKYQSFEHFGFSKVEATDQVVLLENKPSGLEKYVRKLQSKTHGTSDSAAVIVNCNPFTLGHRYLIERAAQENEQVHVFVLKENLSTFPSDVRFKLVEAGTKDLKNVVVHWAEDYVISAATFPSYFLGDHADIIRVHTELDAKIFGNHIAKALQIKKRYLGKEPLNPVTNQYNQALKKVLPNYGIQVQELERKDHHREVISASTVRQYLVEDQWAAIKELVPESTWVFLNSVEAKPIINTLKQYYKPEKLV